MSFTVVGDTDQSLYGFQGSKPELLTGEIEQWLPGIQTIKLETFSG
jgi:superfamily I DNA/RNA helicase